MDLKEKTENLVTQDREAQYVAEKLLLLRLRPAVFDFTDKETGIRLLTVRDDDRIATEISGLGDNQRSREVSLPVFQHFFVFPEAVREQVQAEFSPNGEGKAYAGRDNEAFLGSGHTGIGEAFDRLDKTGIVFSDESFKAIFDANWQAMPANIAAEKQAQR